VLVKTKIGAGFPSATTSGGANGQHYWYLFISRDLIRKKLKPVIFSGKDITHKLYSMNEHLLASASAMAEQQAAKAALALQKQQELDASLPWHEQRPSSTASENMFLSRSLSVDAVHTGSRGHVRSMTWMERHQRQTSLIPDSK
jgi:hypothetical protein